MTNARCRIDHRRLAIDDADDGVFGAGRDARCRAAAQRQVDLRMQ
jgi:hypothetical protein